MSPACSAASAATTCWRSSAAAAWASCSRPSIRELKRCVAIKVLSPHLAASSLARKRFAREAQAAAAVVHANVLAIHQVQPAGRLPFLVMPLVAGESLAQRLTAQGRLELKEILRIGMQAAAGLAAAHEQGLVHRDVKPANILLEKGVERAVLTDFGLARAADDVSMTRWGIIAGTPQYMSPEQARGEPLDCRSDLFSLGCVLYEMATGVSPFRTDSTLATLRRLIDDAPQSMLALNPELPPWFVSIVDRLLEKDPAKRFSSAKEVSELLEGCLAHLQQPSSVPLPEAVVADASPTRKRVGNKSPTRKQGLLARASGLYTGRTFFTKGTLLMLSLLAISLFAVGVATTNPPDISGQWQGPDWGQVVLKQTAPGQYAGSYNDTVGKGPGRIELKWSRIERRFNGTWREGDDDRFGELSIRPVGNEIRGARTTDPKSKINPATPRLEDLLWMHTLPVTDTMAGAIAKATPELRYLAWQDENMHALSGQSRQEDIKAWRTDGSLVDTDAERITILRHSPTMVVSGAKDGDKAHILDLWFSVRGAATSWVSRGVTIEIKDDGGHVIPASNTGSISNGGEPGADGMNWFVCHFAAAVGVALPPKGTVVLEYPGAWRDRQTKVASSFQGVISVDRSTISVVGQSAKGRAFVTISRGPEEAKNKLWDFRAESTDGKILEPVSVSANFAIEQFEFDAPLSQIKVFRLGEREIKRIEFRSVALRPGQKTDMQVVVPSTPAEQSDLLKLFARWEERRRAISTASIEARLFRQGGSDVNHQLSAKDIEVLTQEYGKTKDQTRALESLIRGLRPKWAGNGPLWDEVSFATDGRRTAERSAYHFVRDARANVRGSLPSDQEVMVWSAGKCGYGTLHLADFASELRPPDKSKLQLTHNQDGFSTLSFANSEWTIEIQVDDKTGIIRRYTSFFKGELKFEVYQFCTLGDFPGGAGTRG